MGSKSRHRGNTDSDNDSSSSPSSSDDDSSSENDDGVASAAMAVIRKEGTLVDQLQSDSAPLENGGEMVLSMSPETVMHFWAVIGLFLAVNVTFCLYKVCRSN